MKLLTSTQKNNLRISPPEAELAPHGAIMKLYETASLDVTIQGKSYPGEFLATQDSHHDLVLGTTWMCDHGVIIDNLTNCLYLGLKQRQRVFTASHTRSSNMAPPVALKEIINHEFDDAYANKFWELVECHSKIFFQGGKLNRALAVQHEIHLRNNQPFRIPIRGYYNAH